MEKRVLEIFVRHARGFLDELEKLASADAAKAPLERELAAVAPAAEGPRDRSETTKAGSQPKNRLPTAEELAAMPFNDLRSLGASLRVKSSGKRSEIEANILEYVKSKAAETPKEEPEEAEAAAEGESESGEARDDEETDEEEETEEDEIREACENMTDEELQEALKSVSLPAHGKRTALVDRIVKAVADGVLDWADDEGPGEGENDESEADETLDVYEEFPELTVNDPKQAEITEERRAKLEELDAIYESDEEGEGESVIDELLVGHFGAKFKTGNYDIGQKTLLYYEVMKLYVDDDGDEHSVREGYYLNGELYCCAKPVKKDGACRVCGDEYSVEDEGRD